VVKKPKPAEKVAPEQTKGAIGKKPVAVKKLPARKPIKRKVRAGPEKKPETEQANPVSFIPTLKAPIPAVSVLEQKRIDIIEAEPELAKKTIRRSGLEIKKAEELQEKKKIAQEKEWEIPAFLRKVKFKS